MDILRQFVDLFLHLDAHLSALVQTYGTWTYAVLFAIIFCETGLVIMPFLPGDSLLFAAGALAGIGALQPVWLIAILTVAAIAGDTVNYWAGLTFGGKVLERPNSRFIKREHLEKTHQFYEKYGAKTIVLARFVPIVRTLAPFVAGIGKMSYATFISYNVIGGIAWILLCVGGGYFFGNIPVVQKHFSLVLLAIVFISILPAIIEIYKERRLRKSVSPK